MLPVVSGLKSRLLSTNRALPTSLQFWFTQSYEWHFSIGSIDSTLSSPTTPSLFHSMLKSPPPSANPSHRSLPFLLEDWLHRFLGLFTDTSEHIRFYFSVFGSVRTLTTWRCPHLSTARRCCWSRPCKPAAAGLLLWTDRRTDTVPLHRPCSACYTGSVDSHNIFERRRHGLYVRWNRKTTGVLLFIYLPLSPPSFASMIFCMRC